MKIPNKPGVYEGDGVIIAVGADEIVVHNTITQDQRPQTVYHPTNQQPSTEHKGLKKPNVGYDQKRLWKSIGQTVNGLNKALSGEVDDE